VLVLDDAIGLVANDQLTRRASVPVHGQACDPRLGINKTVPLNTYQLSKLVWGRSRGAFINVNLLMAPC
jgi:hypothetical protein